MVSAISLSSYYEKLLATGEVKCIDDEIPFEIPQGWEWCRMGGIIELLSGQDFMPEKYNSKNQGIPYITGASSISNGKLIINRWTECPSVIGKLGDLLIVCKGSGVGKMCFCNVEKIHIARQIQIIRGFSSFICMSYLKLIIDANLSAITSNAQGVIPGISREHILNLIIPIPPFNAQQHIIKKLKLLQPLIQLFDSKQEELNNLDTSIKELLKKSILQEAIQGKLVPQIAEEGIAQELLEQIRQEKQELVKEGKLKKSTLIDSVIYKGDDNKYFEKNGKIEKDITNEIPFEIPDTWAWSRLSNLVILLSGRDLEPSQYNSVSNGIPYMTGASNFRNGNLIKNRWTETPIVISILGDLLITCKGTIGEMSFNTIGDIHIARQIMALRSSFDDSAESVPCVAL
ncbi:MAG: restriction endonuclease subunit S [Phocaeicola sp.]|uniref:restriction endonuclease subunit S n=1 Tax=Phocaeicola sp. TaxID=2773926 RepID=UPI00300F1C20